VGGESNCVHSALRPLIGLLCQKLRRLVAGFPPRRSGFQPRSSCGIYGGQSGTGAGFVRVLRFPLPIRIPPSSVETLLNKSTITCNVIVFTFCKKWRYLNFCLHYSRSLRTCQIFVCFSSTILSAGAAWFPVWEEFRLPLLGELTWIPWLSELLAQSAVLGVYKFYLFWKLKNSLYMDMYSRFCNSFLLLVTIITNMFCYKQHCS
jgi:hypothetical protein